MSFLCVFFNKTHLLCLVFFCEAQYLAVAPGVTGSMAFLTHFALGRPLKYDCISLCLQLNKTVSALVCLQLCVAKRLQLFSFALRVAGGALQHDLCLMESTGLSGVFKQINTVCDQVHDSRGLEIIGLVSCALHIFFISRAENFPREKLHQNAKDMVGP